MPIRITQIGITQARAAATRTWQLSDVRASCRKPQLSAGVADSRRTASLLETGYSSGMSLRARQPVGKACYHRRRLYEPGLSRRATACGVGRTPRGHDL